MDKEIKKLTPFDFINSINGGQAAADLMADCSADNSESLPDPSRADRQYVPFIINRGLSYFNDTVLFANEMNRYSSLPHKMQYDFLKNAIRPRKRFSKWAKSAADDESIALIMKEYDYSAEKARAVVHLFSDSALLQLKRRHDHGGR